MKVWQNDQAKRDHKDRGRREAATGLVCEHVFVVAGWCGGRGVGYAQNFDPTLASAGRPVTLQTLLDAHTAIADMIAVFEQRGL